MEMEYTLPYKPLTQQDLPTPRQTLMGSDTCTKVLVGEYTVGRQGLVAPTPKNYAYDVCDTYDTVVDNVTNPGIFVVFYDWQCYPEYLITFQ